MRPNVLSALVTASLALLTGCGGGGSSPPAQAPHFNGNPPLVPANGIYVGAFVNTGGTTPLGQQLTQFEAQIGRTLALSGHYYGWNSTFPTQAESADARAGRIPVISWNCGVSNAQVASGSQDANIVAHAAALKAYGGPVFVRYLWEMNLGATANNRSACYDPATDSPGGVFSPAEFIAAWNHIHSIFVAQGANNVAFLWNPGGGGTNATLYYPGGANVDWVGIDEYDRNSVPFADVYSLYSALVPYNKPIMIAETGASPTYQPVFFTGAAAVLKTTFPAVKGFMYFDAEGKDDWRLSSTGVTAFAAFANDPYLSAR